MLFTRKIARKTGKRQHSINARPQLENLENRIVPSFADGNGAVINNVTTQNNGAQLILSFDGPLDANPTNPVQSPTNVANYSVVIPSANATVITSSTSTLVINSATYDSLNLQVTLNLATPLTAGTFYRVFVNGTPSADGTANPGLLDSNKVPIDGDYDDTSSGNFYALFAWTQAGTPLSYKDSGGDQISLTLTGPGQLYAWRQLNGDFNALNLASQSNLTAGAVQQITVAGGTLGSTVLTGTSAFATGNAIAVVPPIAGQGITFTNTLPAYFQQAPAALPLPPTPIVATGNSLPYTLQIQQVTTAPNLPAVQSPVVAQDDVAGSPFLGYWLVFGGRDNGLHSFNATDNFPPQKQNENIYVINPANWQVWTKAWGDTNVPAATSQPLYSTNQQSFQSGDNLFTVGGYGAPDLGNNTFGTYTTYDTLTALSVNGMINAIVNNGDVAALSQLQQIHDSRLQVTGGEMKMLGTQALIVVGQDFQGEYFGPTAIQTYTDEIRSFQITYNGQTPNSLAISNYQAQNDQVNFRRRDYNLGDVIQSNLQPALEILGGVFTPGPFNDPAAGQGYRQPMLINGLGSTQLSQYQQFFSQYSSPNIGLFSASQSSMYTILLGGIGLYNYTFTTGQLTSDTELPFVDDVTTLVQNANGSQEYAMPSQLPGFYGAEARFFANPQLAAYSNGVIQLDSLTQSATLGYMYGGIFSTAANTTDQTTQTKASNALFKVVLVPAPTVTLSSAATNPTSAVPIPITASFSQHVTGLTAAGITVSNATVTNLQPVNPSGGLATTWTFDLAPLGPGAVSTSIHAGSAQNSAGTNNMASNNFSINYQPAAQTVGSYNPATATWYLRTSNSSGPPTITPFAYGAPDWYPITGDWNGDGVTTIGVVDLSTETWYLRDVNSVGPPTIPPFRYGAPGWIPVVGNWNGTGHSGIGVFDPSTATWYLRNEDSSGLPDAAVFSYGAPGWAPLTGNWSSIGHAGIGVFNPANANWYLRNELSAGPPDANPGGVPFAYGAPNWQPVVGDWAGTGLTRVGVVNPATQTWYLRNSLSSGQPDFTPFAYGAPGWIGAVGTWQAPGQPQLAASKPITASATALLTNTQLHLEVAGALARLRADGIAPNVLAALSSIQFSVGNLTNHELAMSYVGTHTVVVDASAAGFGWFVDQTPLQDNEFANFDGAITAKSGSLAAGHMDLLTVLLHELGHFEGWTELDPTLHPDALMALTLGTGTRRTQDLDQVFATR
jgi:hypothetical protein